MREGIATPAVFLIYQNKTLITIPQGRTFLTIEHELAAQSFRTYFNSMWEEKNQLLSGPDGVVQLCEKILEEGEDLYLIGATGSIMQTQPHYFEQFTAERIRKNIKLYLLANQNIKDTPFTKQFLSEVRYLPHTFEFPTVSWVFGAYVATVVWSDPSVIFLLNDIQVADNYRTYYNDCTKQAK